MSALGRRLPVELFTAASRVTGTVVSRHIHIRDELNDARLSALVFTEMQVATLSDLRGARVVSGDAWLKKTEILLAVPLKVKGATSALAQRSIQTRLGKNEQRILLDLVPFRVEGTFFYAGKVRVDDPPWREGGVFASLSDVQVTFVPDPAISFAVDELSFNTERIAMFCADFQMT
jgi:hypothetical protein